MTRDAARVVKRVSYAGESPVFDNPSDYGLDYEDVTFSTDDGVKLSGCFIRGAGPGVIVQTHFGGVSSRAGYTPDGKGDAPPWPDTIHYLRHVKAFVDQGYSVLAYGHAQPRRQRGRPRREADQRGARGE